MYTRTNNKSLSLSIYIYIYIGDHSTLHMFLQWWELYWVDNTWILDVRRLCSPMKHSGFSKNMISMSAFTNKAHPNTDTAIFVLRRS